MQSIAPGSHTGRSGDSAGRHEANLSVLLRIAKGPAEIWWSSGGTAGPPLLVQLRAVLEAVTSAEMRVIKGPAASVQAHGHNRSLLIAEGRSVL